MASLRLLIFSLGFRFSWSPLLDSSHHAVQSSFHCFNCQVSGPLGSSFRALGDLTVETVTDGVLHLYRAKQLHRGGLKSIKDVALSSERELTSVVEHLSVKAATTIIQVTCHCIQMWIIFAIWFNSGCQIDLGRWSSILICCFSWNSLYLMLHTSRKALGSNVIIIMIVWYHNYVKFVIP